MIIGLLLRSAWARTGQGRDRLGRESVVPLSFVHVMDASLQWSDGRSVIFHTRDECLSALTSHQ